MYRVLLIAATLLLVYTCFGWGVTLQAKPRKPKVKHVAHAKRVKRAVQSRVVTVTRVVYVKSAKPAAKPPTQKMVPVAFVKTDVFVGDKLPEKTKKEGYHTFRIPALVKTTTGDLLAFCEARRDSEQDSGKIDLVLKRSTDGGATWGPLQVIYADTDNVTIGNPVPIVDQPTGDILLLFCKDNHTGVYLTRSHDNGATWSAPRNLPLVGKPSLTARGTSAVAGPAAPTLSNTPIGAIPATFTVSSTPPVTGPAALSQAFGFPVQRFGTGPCHGLQLKTGRMVVPIWFEGTSSAAYPGPNLDPRTLKSDQLPLVTAKSPFTRHFAALLVSDDHGETWRAGGRLPEGANESTVAELPDGTLVCNSRFEPSGTYRIIARSSDHGGTFKDVALDYNLRDVKCQGSLLAWAAAGNHNYLVFTNPAVVGKDAKRRAHLTVHLSTDGGKSWPLQHEIETGPSAYSDVCALSDSTIAVLYERGKKSFCDRITFVHLPLAKKAK